jgi:hypothetical protein
MVIVRTGSDPEELENVGYAKNKQEASDYLFKKGYYFNKELGLYIDGWEYFAKVEPLESVWDAD